MKHNSPNNETQITNLCLIFKMHLKKKNDTIKIKILFSRLTLKHRQISKSFIGGFFQQHQST